MTAVTDALRRLVELIDAANLYNLSRGVELGPTVWFVKATEAMEAARAALAAAEKDEGELVAALRECELQLEYLAEKFQPTSTGVAVLSRVRAALSKHATPEHAKKD